MRSRIPRTVPLGIRTRLVLISLLIETVVITALSMIAVLWYQEERFGSFDVFLQSEAEGIIGVVESYLAAQQDSLSDSGGLPRNPETVLEGGQPNEIIPILASGDFLGLVRGLENARAEQPRAYKAIFAIYEPSGTAIVQSNMSVPGEVFDQATDGDARDIAVSTENGPIYYRVLKMDIVHGADIIGDVRIASLATPVREGVMRFISMLALAVPLLLAINGIAAVILLRKAFHPVTMIMESTRRITEADLSIRVPVPPAEDEIRILAITFNDMLDRLDRAFKAQVALVEDLSHQLRTPLAVIRGFLEMGTRRERSREEYVDILERSLDEVDRISSLIDTMLGLAQLDSGSIHLRKAPMDIRFFFEELRDDLQPLWEQKELTVHINAEEGLPSLYGDALRLRQVFLNIFDNAVKASPQGGRIDINLSLSGQRPRVSPIPLPKSAGFLLIRVCNEGEPIEEDEIHRIFERFYRGRATIANQAADGGKKGFGLGLSICRSIVNLHHGEIRAANLPYTGVAFEVVLPV